MNRAEKKKLYREAQEKQRSSVAIETSPKPSLQDVPKDETKTTSEPRTISKQAMSLPDAMQYVKGANPRGRKWAQVYDVINQGVSEGNADAMFALSQMYLKGLYVEKDIVKAKFLNDEAYKLGSVAAKWASFHTSEFQSDYIEEENDDDDEIDDRKQTHIGVESAIEASRFLIEQWGKAPNLHNLLQTYNASAVFDALYRASNGGNGEASLLLAIWFKKGIYVSKNNAHAEQLLALSKRQGYHSVFWSADLFLFT